MTHPLSGPALKAARRLKFPRLMALTAALFVVDLLVPDPVPFLDEILLGLAALILASWRESRAAPTPGSVEKE